MDGGREGEGRGTGGWKAIGEGGSIQIKGGRWKKGKVEKVGRTKEMGRIWGGMRERKEEKGKAL